MKFLKIVPLASILLLACATCLHAQDVQAPAKSLQATVDAGAAFLVQKGQAENGSFSEHLGLGPTGLALTALLRSGRTPDDPAVAKGLKYLLDSVQPDGGIYQTGTFYRNYETSTSLLALGEANRDGKYDGVIRRAVAFLKNIQWDESEDIEPANLNYGGAGYGSQKRPDLSNTSFLLDALRSAGTDEDDPAMKKALIFVSRCQNLETQYNTTPFAAKNPDGGFYYTCAAGGQSKAGETPDGGLRSYANMTYAGLKSMLYAGVDQDDPRVKAAVSWIRKHYTLDTNPGLAGQGLYYYYQIFAKALDALGEDTFTDADGKKHDWRKELAAALAKRQQTDGSWVNPVTRWCEGDPNLVTAYALLALSYCGE
jgi:squalene-hopene/tetraprenyl-beta-curcumene cyclase